MNILSPLTTVEEVEPLIKAGADELYCGIISDNWRKKFKDITCLGRFESSQPNFSNFGEVKKAVEIADTYNKPIFLTVNAPYYSKRQFKLIEEDINKAFNVGINSGEDAGQSIFHCHYHLIPRRKGDTENPRGGVRGVIPRNQSYRPES